MSSSSFNPNSLTVATIKPYVTLARIAARTFYDDITSKKPVETTNTNTIANNVGRTGSRSGADREEGKGIAVLVVDGVTRGTNSGVGWVREDDLGRRLRLNGKSLRKVLRVLEEEKFVVRVHRRESVVRSGSVEGGGGGEGGGQGSKRSKQNVCSYCCLDYAQIYDVIRYRLCRMKKMLNDLLANETASMQEYVCPKCASRFTALDAANLISMEDEYFHCEKCDTVLVVESEKLGTQALGVESNCNSRRQRELKIRDFIHRMELQLEPLEKQLEIVKDLPAPEFVSLQNWEAGVRASSSVATDGAAPAAVPILGDMDIEVNIHGLHPKEEGSLRGTQEDTQRKIPVPWMPPKNERHDGLTEARYSSYSRRGWEQVEARTWEPGSSGLSSYDASGHEMSPPRQVGQKVKHKDDNDDDIVWEEGDPLEYSRERFEVGNGANAEAASASTDDDDNIDWEEG
ncbi:hypothetical protein Droror1_Dr00021745 [Drosera rotundifolia]